MAVSSVSICNQALGWLGEDSIITLDPPITTKSQQLCADNYPDLRDAVLEEREWTFAVRRFELTPLVATPVYGYPNQFLLPNEVLRVLNLPWGSTDIFGGLLGLAGGASADLQQQFPDWRVESIDSGTVVLANLDRIRIRCIVRIVNEKLWSPMFVQSLAARIAADLAMPLTNNRVLQKDMWNLYEMKLGKAATMDGMQGSNEIKRSDRLINVR